MTSCCLTATFTRHRGANDHVHVTRTDGTSTEWEFPSYGDAVPHDLIHLVVERGLGMTDGFWGLIDGGANVVMVGDQAVLSRNGEPLKPPDVDFRALSRPRKRSPCLVPSLPSKRSARSRSHDWTQGHSPHRRPATRLPISASGYPMARRPRRSLTFSVSSANLRSNGANPATSRSRSAGLAAACDLMMLAASGRNGCR